VKRAAVVVAVCCACGGTHSSAGPEGAGDASVDAAMPPPLDAGPEASAASDAGLDAPPGADAGPAWTMFTPLPVARYEGFAVTRKGLVYFLGGVADVPGQPNYPSDHVDVLDPQSGIWSSAPPLPADAPHHHLAIAVQNDVIYVLGGYLQSGDQPGGQQTVDTAYALDDAGWHKLANPPVARQGATAQSMGGKIYVAGGGLDENTAIGDLYVYDPAADTWTPGPAMPTARSHVASCVVAGEMIVGGGFRGNPVVTMANVEGFDPVRGTWRTLPALPTARGAFGAAAVGGACVFVGGLHWDLPYAIDTVVESLDVASGTYTTLPPLAVARHSMGVTWAAGSIFAIAGRPTVSDGYLAVDERYTP
jgi:hypothetical protein